MELALPLAAEIAPASAETAGRDRAAVDNGRLQAIVDALPEVRYPSVLALGVAPGLSRRLDGRSDSVEQLSAAAAAGVWPGAVDGYDLVILTDVLYGADPEEMGVLVERVLAALNPGGQVLLAHWLDERGADERAAEFVAAIGEHLAPVSRQRTPYYRLDVLERA